LKKHNGSIEVMQYTPKNLDFNFTKYCKVCKCSCETLNKKMVFKAQRKNFLLVLLLKSFFRVMERRNEKRKGEREKKGREERERERRKGEREKKGREEREREKKGREEREREKKGRERDR
jgi:hypothetical protein